MPASRKQTRRRSSRKAEAAPMAGGKRKSEMAPMAGGKRKTRKASPWNKFVQKIYLEMKRAKGKAASFSDALKEASRRKSEM